MDLRYGLRRLSHEGDPNTRMYLEGGGGGFTVALTALWWCFVVMLHVACALSFSSTPNPVFPLKPSCVKTTRIQEHRHENAAYTRTMGFVQFRCRQE